MEEIIMKNESNRIKEMQADLEKERRGFRIHRRVYSLVIPLLALVNILTVPHFLWVLFPLFGWGFGLTMHYVFAVRIPEKELAHRGGEA